jgi:putative Holliday junction resolvase
MRILGVDLGERTLGLALSDPLGIVAGALQTIRRTSESKDLLALAGVMAEQEVGEIVVGLPLNMNGTRGPQAEKAEAFAQKLRERFKLPVHLWDERLSTVAAERSLLEADLSRKKRKRVIDQVAAALFLQSFLDARALARKDEA